MFILRKRIELTEKDAIFIYINGVLPKNTLTFEQIYSEYKNDDNFLYIEYGLENTFG